MNPSKKYMDIIDGFGSKRILVIGDLILDVYLKGRSTRLCPEAPVPVVDVDERKASLGGAANTACNVRALGASVTFCAVTGDDPEADEAFALLAASGVDTTCVIRSRERRTITKSRIVSGSQVITRIDQGSEGSISDELDNKMAALVETAYRHCDAVIISDYDKGLITEKAIEVISRLRKRDNKFVAVDSKRMMFFSDLPPSCAKPNYDEILKLLDLRPAKKRIEQVMDHSQQLFQKIKAPIILATLDEDGSVVIERGRVTHRIPTRPASRPNVSGAGDSYISAFVLSWLNGNDTENSAEIASMAAAIAIQKEGTASCQRLELRNVFNIDKKYIASMADLSETCDSYHAAGKKIVFTNGCFDILHSGHVSYLHKAKQLGDVLIVGLNNDDSIRRIKGKSRPINVLGDRIQVLAGLSSVDHIIAFGNAHDDTPIPLIEAVKPDIFVKGGDYTMESLPEAKTVKKCGGKVVFIDHIPERSTTHIISRIRSQDLNAALSKTR